MTTTIQTNVVQRINELHLKAIGAAAVSKHSASEAIEAAWECGKILNVEKDNVEHGEWLEWLAQNCPNIVARTAQRYMELASKYDTLSHLKDSQLQKAYIAAGILPEPELSTSTSAIVPEITRLEQKVRLLKDSVGDVDKLKPEQREQYKTTIKPLVELYERL